MAKIQVILVKSEFLFLKFKNQLFNKKLVPIVVVGTVFYII